MVVALGILVRFFFSSMIAYAFFLRGKHMRTMIERHWMAGRPTLDEICREIQRFDHGRSQPNTGRNLLVSQIRSGIIVVLIPVIILGVELVYNHDYRYWVMVGLVAIYTAFEWYNFRTYDQVKKSTANQGLIDDGKI